MIAKFHHYFNISSHKLIQERKMMLALVRFITIALLILPAFSKNLRRNEINTTLDNFSHIDDSFLVDKFDEMETMLHEYEDRIAIIEESQGMTSAMLLEEVNSIERRLIYSHIDYPKAEL